MERLTKISLAFLAAASLLVVALPGISQATTITFNLSQAFSGDTPPGTSPWLSLTIEDVTANTVKLTFSTNPAGPGVLTDGFVHEWLFNVNNTNVLATSFTFDSGNSTGPAASIQIDSGNIPPTTCSGGDLKADGDGCYSIEFDFPTPALNRFNAGETVVYTANATGLDATDFNVLGTPSANGQYFSAAHIQGFGQNCSGWIGAPGTAGGSGASRPECGGGRPPSEVPQPSTLLLLGGGLLGLAGVARFARKNRKDAK